MDKEASLEAVQKAMVGIHQLLAGMLADIYFLWLNPLHEPRLFALTADKFPAEWLDTVFGALRDVQARRLAEYERALREKEQSRELVERQERERAELEQLFQVGYKAYEKDNYREALRYLSKAANAGHALAQANLGAMYYCGQGVTTDLAQGVYWIRRAADQGHADSQDLLASFYEEDDRGVNKDIDEAIRWYMKAAEQNHSFAWIMLGKNI